MKTAELRQMTDEQLTLQLKEVVKNLFHLRFQSAMQHGPDAAVLVLEGWEDEMGRKATDVAYWDAVAALNTRTDLDALDASFGTNERRDDFLRAAVDELV